MSAPHPVILVSLDWIRPGDPRTGLGTASIASSLKLAGISVEIVADAVNRPGFNADAFIARTHSAVDRAETPPLVGIGAFVWNEPEVLRLLASLKSRPDVHVVLGGPQISYAGSGSLESLYPGVGHFIRGHGELGLVGLARGEAAEGVFGVHVAGAVDKVLKADLPLDALPSPHLDGTLPIGEFVRWETQRGCRFSCNFCQHREPGSRLVRRELGDVRLHQEIAAFAAAEVRRVAVLDPIFHENPRRAVGLLGEMNRVGLRSQLSLQCRFEMIDDEFLDALRGLDVVLEFGLQTAIDAEARAVRRPNRLDKVSNVIDRLHDRGITFEVSLIYGLPLQTFASFVESVTWCKEHRVPRVRAWPLMLLRGTELYLERKRWGFVESVGERIPIVVGSDTFSREDHLRMTAFAERVNQQSYKLAAPRDRAHRTAAVAAIASIGTEATSPAVPKGLASGIRGQSRLRIPPGSQSRSDSPAGGS